MRYQSPADAAENINVLINYLGRSENSSSRYIYRGQVMDWQAPLIPSLYRRSIRLSRTFTDRSTEYVLCLRKCGRCFIEMKPDSYIERLIPEHSHITSGEKEAILALAGRGEFSILFEREGWDAALIKVIRPEKLAHVRDRLPLWKTIVEELQRGHIRHDGFVQPFGYMLGMTLAQQYGFASELIDFTSDLRVAAFFATHDGPKYFFEGASLLRRTGYDYGVIYRMPSTEGNVKYSRIDDYNYYNCPAQLHMRDLCMRFEDKSSPEMTEQWINRLPPEGHAAVANATIIVPYFEATQSEMEMSERHFSLLESFDRYFHLYYTGGTIRYYRLLDLPPGSFAQSRLGRQSAVLVVPDELRETVKEEGKQHYAVFQAVEDVSKRDGFERFYFRQTNTRPEIGEIDREYLWPSENYVFRIMISRVLDPSTEVYDFMGREIPKRLSLVSAGFVR
jgi:hypothetical protein